jgi:hypothetical protein
VVAVIAVVAVVAVKYLLNTYEVRLVKE